MLTVIREMAEEAEANTNPSPVDLLHAVVARGADAVERTPQYLDVLRDAGVVDAGAVGLLELVRGLTAAFAGEPIPEAPEPVELTHDAIHQELSEFRYCTIFVVEGEGLDANTLEARLEPLGDSLLVVGDESARADHVIVLPNNPNVILAAEQAAELSDKDVRVIRTDSIPSGLAALVAFDPARDADENVAEMEEALATVATGAVTVASKDAQLNGLRIQKGNFLGLAGGVPIAQGESFDEVATAVVERLLAEPRGVMTFLTGEEEPDLAELVARVQAQHPDVELEVHSGGQPHYPLLLSAE